MSLKFAGLWRQPDFLKLWAGETVSLLGSQISLLAIPLTAVLILQATPTQIGLLGAAEFAPLLFLSLLAGVWIDRLPRRPVMLAADCGSALLLSTIPLASCWGFLSMDYLYIVSFLVGVCSVLFFIAYQSYLPTLVETQYLVEGNSKLESSRALAEISGPAIAGQLVQIITAPVAILADAVSFVVSAFFLATVRKPEPPQPKGKGRGNIWQEIGEGLSELVSNPILRSFVICNVTTNFFDTMINTVYTIYLVRELQIEPGLLGFILATGSVGGLIGALLTDKISKWVGLRRILILTNLLFGIGSLLTPLANGPLIVVVPILVVSRFVKGLVNLIYNINQISLRQSITLPQVRGRVNASMRFLAGGITPFGALAGGWFGTVIGLRTTLLVGALGVCLAVLPIIFSPVRNLPTQLAEVE